MFVVKKFLQPDEEQDALGETPSKNDKGIEMEQDFAADTFSVSEDSEEDTNEDGEDEQLDSAIGETGADGEAVDEKLWDKNEDENPDDTKEKYESGPSVRDKDASSRELRAKEDSAVAADELGEMDSHELDKSDSDNGNQDDLGDKENIEDMNLEKEEAFVDSTGLKLDELNQNSEEDMDLDEKEAADSVEEEAPEVQDEAQDECAGDGNLEEEKAYPNDETMVEAGAEELDATSEGDEPGSDPKENAEMGPKRDVFEPRIDDLISEKVPNSETATQPEGDLQESDSRNMAPELNLANSKDIHNGLAPLRGLPSSNSSEMDIMVSESTNIGRNIGDQPQTQLARPESSSVKKNQPNPYRSVGDALKEWKERVNVSFDLQADDMETQGEIQDEDAEEFGYVSEFEKGTAQALGPAMSEQIDKNVSDNKPNEAGLTTDGDDITKIEFKKERSEIHPISSSSILKSKVEDQMHPSAVEKLPIGESQESHSLDDGDSRSLSDSLVSVKKSYLSEDIHQLSQLSIDDNELGKARDLGDTSDYVNNATALWRRYELLTTRLSQEMAEQLRLVMEPTMASKLQGDYKTGKRINMKKVGHYIQHTPKPIS